MVSAVPVTRGLGQGFSVAYSYTTVDGSKQSGLSILLNGPDGALHIANLLFPASGIDLNTVVLDAPTAASTAEATTAATAEIDRRDQRDSDCCCQCAVFPPAGRGYEHLLRDSAAQSLSAIAADDPDADPSAIGNAALVADRQSGLRRGYRCTHFRGERRCQQPDHAASAETETATSEATPEATAAS